LFERVLSFLRRPALAFQGRLQLRVFFARIFMLGELVVESPLKPL
jgi:hypothetical protein